MTKISFENHTTDSSDIPLLEAFCRVRGFKISTPIIAESFGLHVVNCFEVLDKAESRRIVTYLLETNDIKFLHLSQGSAM